MDELTSPIILKLDKLDERLDNVDKNLAVYNEQLKIHIKRTELLEKDVAPIKTHVIQVQGVAKFIAILSALAGIFVLIREIAKVS